MGMVELETWSDLKAALATLTDEQLRQPIQCVQPDGDEGRVQEMVLGIALATVRDFEFYACRSTHNNKYCPDDVVLLMDGNPFGLDGVVAWEWHPDGTETPIYGTSGVTGRDDQMAPNCDELADKWENGLVNHAAVTSGRRIIEPK